MPAVPPAAMSELKWLRKSSAEWFYDDIFLCTHAMPHRVFSWSGRGVVEMSGLSRLRDRYCSSIRNDAALTASFHHEGESLFWNLGPYDRGTYSVVLQDGVQAFEVPRSDGFRLPGLRSLALRVRYRAPEGWVTYSPELRFDLSRADLSWHR